MEEPNPFLKIFKALKRSLGRNYHLELMFWFCNFTISTASFNSHLKTSHLAMTKVAKKDLQFVWYIMKNTTIQLEFSTEPDALYDHFLQVALIDFHEFIWVKTKSKICFTFQNAVSYQAAKKPHNTQIPTTCGHFSSHFSHTVLFGSSKNIKITSELDKLTWNLLRGTAIKKPSVTTIHYKNLEDAK